MEVETAKANPEKILIFWSWNLDLQKACQNPGSEGNSQVELLWMTTLKQHYCVNSMDTLQETRIATGKLKGIYNYEPKLSIIAVAMAQFLLCRNITS